MIVGYRYCKFSSHLCFILC